MTTITSTAPTRTGLALLERELVRLFRAASHAKVHHSANGISVDKAGYQVLHRMSDLAPVRVRDLADAVGVDSSTLSRQVSTLSAAGLVERAADPDDGRACLLQPTTRGSELLAEIRAVRTERLRLMTADWPAGDADTLVRLLGRFNDSLDAMGPAGPAPTTITPIDTKDDD